MSILDDLAQDVRYAVRTLAVSHRTFAVTGVLMLAAGIGVTTAVFSVVSGLLLRPLPFAQPGRLVELHGTMGRGPNWSQVRNLEAYRRDSPSFEGLASYDIGARYLRDAAGAERVMAVRTEGPFFDVLGVAALYGRTYQPADALGIPIKRGRGFTRSDAAKTPMVVVVNETLAARAFPGEDPIGLVTTRGTIVGTIPDVRQVHLDRPAAPEVYTAIAQNWSQVSELGTTLVVKTRERPDALIDLIRSTIREVDPGQAESLSAFTLSLSILSAFAGLAIVLALSGTYGVISYLASSRAREFAIRVALGAGRGRVVRSVLGQGLSLTAIGLMLGVIGALAAAPLVGLAPIAVRRPDALTLVPVALLIAVVAAIAAPVPARRAARVDPMGVLRAD
jgi:MacB-like periplasmic core domain